jgi:hypothetical protein
MLVNILSLSLLRRLGIAILPAVRLFACKALEYVTGILGNVVLKCFRKLAEHSLKQNKN